MNLRSARSKSLARLIEDDDARGLQPEQLKRIRAILTALLAAPNIAEVSGPPGWRIHELKGDRAGTWSISVSGNWRLTFTLDGEDVCNLDLEDYH